jgi:ABC-type transport system involved in cytochrome c biogenesis permease subunit
MLVYALQYMAAAFYLAAGVGGVLGLALPDPRLQRGAGWGLALGALGQLAAFATLHRLEPAPSLSDLGYAIAAMAWLAVIFTLLLRVKYRLPGFVPPLAFVAFLASFGATLQHPRSFQETAGTTIPHAHVLLASAGLAALGLAGLAGLFFLFEHRALKQRRFPRQRFALPSLEALDRVNRVSLALGFPLLSLGVLTGGLWLEARSGSFWSGSLHETWMLVAWVIYVGLVSARFIGRQGARQAAASALASFAFLLIAVVGAGVVS